MQFSNPFSNRQPKPKATTFRIVGLGRHEWLEYLRRIKPANSTSFVTHQYFHITRTLATPYHGHGLSKWRSIYSIKYKINKKSLKKHSVTPNKNALLTFNRELHLFLACTKRGNLSDRRENVT